MLAPTHRVSYTYVGDTALQSPDLGVTSDLVQVAVQERIDPDPGATAPMWRKRYTQYRYHRADAATNPAVSDGVDERDYTWTGDDHQLKMVLNADQIEYYAQRTAASFGTPTDGELQARLLLAMPDDEVVYVDGADDVLLVDLASKVVETYETTGEKRVKRQYLQSSCGCSGAGTQGLRLDYEYWSYTVSSDTKYFTVRVEEKTGPSWSLFRTWYYNLELIGSPPMSGPDPRSAYLVNKALVDTSGNKWVVHYEYDANDDDNCTEWRSPSNCDTYTTGNSTTQWTYSAKTNAGLIYKFVFTTDNRISEFKVQEGTSGTAVLVSKTTFGSGTGATRKFLPDKIERYRVAGSSSANDVETSEFAYGFHSGDALGWVETSVEAELAAENGPGGTYESYELFDTRGNNFWSRSADGMLTYRTFDTDAH